MKFKCAFLIACLSFACSNDVLASEEPSLQETIKWIHNTTRDRPGFGGHKTRIIMKSCDEPVLMAFVDDENNRYVWVREYFSIGDVQLEDNVHNSYVNFKCVDTGLCVTHKPNYVDMLADRPSKSRAPEKKARETSTFIISSEIFPRLAKAWGHLQKLCGATPKKSPF